MNPYNPPESAKKLSAAALKRLALFSMLCSHVAEALIKYPCLAAAKAGGSDASPAAIASALAYSFTYPPHSAPETLYLILDALGRMAFPIFAFCLAESVAHTKSRTRLCLRLLAFAFISEVPFDLALFGTPFSFERQNIFFTLFLGVAAAWSFDALRGKWLPQLAAFACILTAAHFSNCDYGIQGVLLIFAFWLLRSFRIPQLIAGFVIMCTAFPFVALGLVPLYFYSGEKGRSAGKYFFYAFYPAHLLLLWGLRLAIFKV